MLQSLTSNKPSYFSTPVATMADLADMFKTSAPVAILENPEITWKKERWGKFTASNFGKLFISGRGKSDAFGKVALGYIEQIAAQRQTVFNLEDEITSRHIETGREREAFAIQTFAERTGLEPYLTGGSQRFAVSSCGNYGGTPDGLIGENAGLEAKSPKYTTHHRYLSRIKTADDLLDECPDYYWQCQGGMELTGRDLWYWISYHPDMKNDRHKLLVVEVKRDEQAIAMLKERLLLAIEYCDKIIRSTG